jgi:hypothetical protein
MEPTGHHETVAGKLATQLGITQQAAVSTAVLLYDLYSQFFGKFPTKPWQLLLPQ